MNHYYCVPLPRTTCQRCFSSVLFQCQEGIKSLTSTAMILLVPLSRVLLLDNAWYRTVRRTVCVGWCRPGQRTRILFVGSSFLRQRAGSVCCCVLPLRLAERCHRLLTKHRLACWQRSENLLTVLLTPPMGKEPAKLAFALVDNNRNEHPAFMTCINTKTNLQTAR